MVCIMFHFVLPLRKLSVAFRRDLGVNFKVMFLSQISKASLGTVASCGHKRWSSKWMAALNTQELNLSSCSSWEGYRNSAGNQTTLGCKNRQRSHAQQVEVSFLLSTTSALSTLFFRNTSSRFTSFSKVTAGSNCTNCGIHELWAHSFPQNCERQLKGFVILTILRA